MTSGVHRRDKRLPVERCSGHLGDTRQPHTRTWQLCFRTASRNTEVSLSLYGLPGVTQMPSIARTGSPFISSVDTQKSSTSTPDARCRVLNGAFVEDMRLISRLYSPS